MQFLVIGTDGTDEGALDRRMANREAHLKGCADAVAKGEQLIGVAMLNDAGKMYGSAMVMDFPDRAALDEWLKREPYVAGKVWDKIEVIPCKVPDAFAHCFPKK